MSSSISGGVSGSHLNSEVVGSINSESERKYSKASGRIYSPEFHLQGIIEARNVDVKQLVQRLKDRKVEKLTRNDFDQGFHKFRAMGMFVGGGHFGNRSVKIL